MTRDELRGVVLDALAQVAPEADPASLKPDADLRDELEIDSMDVLNFAIAVHERTGVEIPESDYRQLATIERCVDYLASRPELARPAS